MQAIYEDFKMALGAVRTHKLRAVLTVLGVVIGVITVMLMTCFIAGIEAQLTDSIESFGARSLFIYKFEPGIHLKRLSPEERQRPPLKFEDGLAIGQYCPSVEVAVSFNWPPEGSISAVRYRDEELYAIQIRGTFPAYERISNVAISQGRFFTDTENERRQFVCLIGAFIADKLFPYVSPLGKDLMINGHKFIIIGVLEKQESIFASEGMGGGENNRIYVPYETLKKMYPHQEENFIMAQARQGRVEQAIDEVTELLRRRRGVPASQPNNFGIATPESIQKQFDSLVFGIFALMMGIASVALLVGGIGVMNIMLVSVTERTREIGIRKAIGARRSNITWQFLTEAMVLTGLGGLIGILIGWALSQLVKLVLPTSVPLWAPLAGLGVSVTVGLFFGLWPALKAARLDPVEALRYE